MQVEPSQRTKIPAVGQESSRREGIRTSHDYEGSASDQGEEEGAFEHTQSGIVDDKNFDEEATEETEL